jgi:hypothetical protein
MPTPSDDFDSLPAGAYQRRHRRVRYRDPLQVIPIGGPYDPHPRALLAEDVSESGLALTSPELFGVGSRLLMHLEPAIVTEPIRLVGRVIWVVQEGLQERYRLGVEFEDVSEHARVELLRLVQRRGQEG